MRISDWSSDVCSSDLHLMRQLMAGLDAMGDPEQPGASLMPAGQTLEMFVTLTDFYGYLQYIPIHDPPAIRDREHRHTLRFGYRRWPNGSEQSDFTRSDAPALAFAGRAPSAFPGAFPPAKLGDMDRLLEEPGPRWPLQRAFLHKNFANNFTAPHDPELTSSIHGAHL